MPLEVANKNESGRVTFKPFVGKVTAHSEYNEPGKKQRFAIEGADNFWSLSDGVRDTRPELGELPPVGTVALWTLQMSPVTGKYAGPNKFYRDVIKVEKVPADYVAPTTGSISAPPATAEDAGYDDYVNKQHRGAPRDAIGPNSKVPPVWENGAAWHTRENREKQASIERQGVLTAEGALIAALAAIKSPPDWVTEQVALSREIFNALSIELARLAPPAAEAGKDEVTDKDGEQIKW